MLACIFKGSSLIQTEKKKEYFASLAKLSTALFPPPLSLMSSCYICESLVSSNNQLKNRVSLKTKENKKKPAVPSMGLLSQKSEQS